MSTQMTGCSTLEQRQDPAWQAEQLAKKVKAKEIAVLVEGCMDYNLKISGSGVCPFWLQEYCQEIRFACTLRAREIYDIQHPKVDGI